MINDSTFAILRMSQAPMCIVGEDGTTLAVSAGFNDWAAEYTGYPGAPADQPVTPAQLLEHARSLLGALTDFEIPFDAGGASIEWTLRGSRFSEKDGSIAYLLVLNSVLSHSMIARSDRVLEAIAKCEHALIEARSYADVLGSVVRMVGTATNADRCYIFHGHFDPISGDRLLSQRVEWTREGISEQIDNPELQNLPWALFADLLDPLLLGRSVTGLVRDLSGAAFDTMNSQEIISYLFMPIMVDGVFWGMIGFDDCQSKRIWGATDLAALLSLAAAIGSAIHKEQLRIALDKRDRDNKLLMSAFGEASWSWDVRQDVMSVSDDWLVLYNFSIADVPRNSSGFLMLFHPDDRPAVDVSFTSFIAGSMERLQVEARLLDGKGVYRWVRIRAVRETDEAENTIRLIGVHRDITAEISDRIKLRTTSERLGYFFDFTSNVMYSFPETPGPQGYVIGGKNNLIGRDLAYLQNNPLEWLNLIVPEDRSSIMNNIGAKWEIGSRDLEYRIALPDGSERWVRDISEVVLDADGDVRVIGILIDIDQAKRAELEIRRLNEELETRVQIRTEELRRAYKALQASEERYRTITELFSDTIYQAVLVPGGSRYMEWATDSFTAMTGYTLDEINSFGKQDNPVFFPEEFPVLGMHLQKLWSGEPSLIQCRMRCKDGTFIWVEEHAQRIMQPSDDGSAHILGVVRNITSQKNMELSLAESERRNRAIVEALPDMVFVISSDAIIESFHAPALGDLYVPPEVFLQKRVQDVLPPPAGQILQDAVTRQLETRALQVANYTLEMGGRPTHFEARLESYSDNSCIALVRDITEQVQYQQNILDLNRTLELRVQERTAELRRSQELYSLIANNSLDLIKIVDPEGVFLFVSPSSKAILGYAPEELLGSSNDILYPDGVLSGRQFLESASLAGDVVIAQRKRKDGSMVDLEMLVSRMTDSTGAHTSYLIIARDVTQRLQAETDLRVQAQMINQIRDVIIVVGMDGTMQRCNIAVARELGYPPEELIGKNVSLLFPPTANHDLWATFTEGLQHRDINEIVIPVLLRTGHQRQFKMRLTLVRDQYGEPDVILVTAFDITEEKLAEERLKRSEERYRLISENSSDLICLHDTDSRFQYVSPSVRMNLGYTPEELLGKKVRDFIDPESHALLALFGPTMHSDAIEQSIHRVRLKHKDGHAVWAEAAVRVLRDASGAVSGFLSTTRDISTRVQYEHELAESEAKYRLISENSSDIVALLNRDLVVTYISPSIRQLGYGPDMFVGMKARQLGMVEDSLHATIEEMFADTQSATFVNTLRTQDGEFRRMETLLTPIRDSGGALVGASAMARDITERERIMRELEIALSREQDLNELQRRFVSTASHQFRTPLTVIQSGMELIEMMVETTDDALKSKLTRQTTRVKSEVVRMTELMNDILLLGRHSARKTPFTPELVDMHAFLTELVTRNFSHRDDDRTVDVSVDADVPHVLLDVKLISHTVLNILSNAFKYSEGGNPALVCTCRASAVRMDITDHGLGIAKEDIPNLFQPFFRGANVTQIQGTGLGLAIAKEFVDIHHGRIEVSSIPGRGTTFSIILPLHSEMHDDGTHTGD